MLKNKIMRIGILTLPLHTNYGGILQAYALQTVLKRMGHEVVIIDEPIRQLKSSNKRIFKRVVKKILGRTTTIFWEKYSFENYPIVSQNINKFINQYLSRIVVNSPLELKETDFDAIVVGSDQIWRPKYYSEICNAFLDFAKDWKHLRRIAYAPSFGTDRWVYTEEQTKQIAELLHMFDAISVREESGIDLCQRHLGVKAILVLDPTMLLSKEDYCNLINKSDTEAPSGGLLKYILDESDQLTELLSFISNEKQIDAFSVKAKSFLEGSKAQDCICPSIETWLRGFRDAKFVVTDSFHACVFSMIFNKPFCVVGNKSRGLARFNSLLKMFNQDFRMVDSLLEYQERAILINQSPNIDFEKLLIKKESLEFLRKALS